MEVILLEKTFKSVLGNTSDIAQFRKRFVIEYRNNSLFLEEKRTNQVLELMNKALKMKKSFLKEANRLSFESYVESFGRYLGNLKSGILGIYWQIDKEEIAKELEWFVERDILFQGLTIKCLRCRKTAWYPLKAITKSITCVRCYNEIRVPFKKELSYKLHTTVFQGLLDNSYLTLWALRQLRRRSRGSFVRLKRR